jgi:Domain of unknown function (DUF5076)
MNRQGPIELIRVLMHPSNDDLQISVRHGAGHPLDQYAKQWGVVLADVVRHLSIAYEKTDGGDIHEVREAILRHLEEDLTKPDPDMTVAPRMLRMDPPGG